MKLLTKEEVRSLKKGDVVFRIQNGKGCSGRKILNRVVVENNDELRLHWKGLGFDTIGFCFYKPSPEWGFGEDGMKHKIFWSSESYGFYRQVAIQ